MNSKIFVSIALILSIVTCAILGTVNASAFEQQEINLSAANSTQSYVTEISNANAYKENETTTAKNDTIQTANIYITSQTATNVRYCERILVGNVSISDSKDYYQIYVEYGKTYKIKLIPVTKNVDINLHLYSASGALLASSALATAYSSEYITYTASSTGNVYIKVSYSSGLSGTATCNYRLLVNEIVGYSNLVQSLFPGIIRNDYFQDLGRNYVDNSSGIVVLTVGYAGKNYGTGDYGVVDYCGNFVTMSQLKEAIVYFAMGYSNNTNHTQLIGIAVSIVNRPANSSNSKYSLEKSSANDGLSVSQRLNSHGIAYANMIKEAAASIVIPFASNRISNVYAAYDSELDWNTYANTYSWISGYGSVASRPKIYVNSNCNISLPNAENTTTNGWNFLNLRNVCCNPSLNAYPMPQAATRLAGRNWLTFFNWLQEKQNDATGSSVSLYSYNTPIGFMNNNLYDSSQGFYTIRYITDYIKNDAYLDTQYNYSSLKNKYGSSLPDAWFADSTWCISGNYYQYIPPTN